MICPLVKNRMQEAGPTLPKLGGRTLATLLAFGVGLMAASASVGPY